MKNHDFNQNSEALFDFARAYALTVRSRFHHNDTVDEVHMRNRTLAVIADGKDFQRDTSPDIAEDASKSRTSPESSVKNQSVIRAFAILKSFYSPDEWVPASELSRRSYIHEATVNRFMHSLMEVGAVVRNQDGHYRCVLFVMPGAHLNSFVAPRHTSQSQGYRTAHS